MQQVEEKSTAESSSTGQEKQEEETSSSSINSKDPPLPNPEIKEASKASVAQLFALPESKWRENQHKLSHLSLQNLTDLCTKGYFLKDNWLGEDKLRQLRADMEAFRDAGLYMYLCLMSF